MDKRKRVQLDLSPKMSEMINDIAERIEAVSQAEVVRRAVSVYAVLLEAERSGKIVKVVDPVSNEQQRVILM